jgi:hypothetical protein
MKKLTLTTREIGNVRVFDLEGSPTQETLQEIAWKIQRNIRRHRLQRIILNLQMLPSLDDLGVRKLLAACIRPQRSLIFGASHQLSPYFEDSYLPRNVRICQSEKEVAENLGPFLLEKESEKEIPLDSAKPFQQSMGYQVERRRSKRMHVAIPLELCIYPKEGEAITTCAIATNISEGGLFAEYLDLEAANQINNLDPIDGLNAGIHIFPSANFPEEYRVTGKIQRKDLRKKQLGIAVEFTEE